jgi:thioredoxin-like negative regulator of GroEL
MCAPRLRGLLAAVAAGSFVAFPAPASGQDSARAQALVREAQQALQSEDYRAAERYFAAAAAADRTSPEASCGLGQVYMSLRQYDSAVEALANCKSQILGNLRRLQTERARSWSRIDDEIRELRDAIQAIQSGQVKSAGADRVHRLEERIRELEQMKSRGGIEVAVPPEVSFALGTALLQVGRLEEAEQELLEVVRAHAGRGDAHNNLAAVYLAQQRWDEAAEQIRLAEEAGVVVNPQMKRDLEFRSAPGIATTAPELPVPKAREDEAVSIRHQGRTCAVKGTFVRIDATVRPPWKIRDPKVLFRTDEAKGWYGTVMLPAGEDLYAAILPKLRSEGSFEYYIEASTFDEEVARTEGVQVTVVKKPAECAEASEDSGEVSSILIIDTPADVADPPPVPPGFSIRGTTADVGVLEMGPNKALIAGGVVLAGAVAGAATLGRSDGDYSGPHPFEDGPGIALVASEPPDGGTLSLNGGELVLRLRLFSPQAIPGAVIVAELAHSGFGAVCIRLTGTQDLPAGREQEAVIRGPTLPASASCDTRTPLNQLRVRVTEPSGLGGFRTGIPPLSHLPVFFHLEE